MFIFFAILLTARTTFGSNNPLLDMSNKCRAIGKDLSQCLTTANCTFYDTTDRAVWNMNKKLQVYARDSDCDCYNWYSGNITMVVGELVTVTLNDCDELTSTVPCAITENRWSFTFREEVPTEKIGMRVNVFREGTWVQTNLTNFGDGDAWQDLWAYGGHYGNIIGLSAEEVRVHKFQDCILDPAEIEPIATQMARDAGQIDEAKACTELIYPLDCNLGFNCVWTDEVCLLSNNTNNLLACYLDYKDATSCESESSPQFCRWRHGSETHNYTDGMCVSGVGTYSLSILALLLLVLIC